MKTQTTQILAILEDHAPVFLAGGDGLGAMAGGGSGKAGTAVSIIGVRGGLRNRSYYGFSMEELRAEINAAANDPTIKSIILNLDSPGGTVDGTPETAAVVAAAAQVKPVIVSVNTLAASAAYWIASQATKIMVSPSAKVGSIGVFATHQDLSKMLEMDGVKITLIHAGEHKVEGNPYEPLSPTARAEIQREVDKAHDQFINAVAAGRKTTPEIVKAKFGKGRLVGAVDAVRLGMADGIAPFEQVVAGELGVSQTRPRRRAIV